MRVEGRGRGTGRRGAMMSIEEGVVGVTRG